MDQTAVAAESFGFDNDDFDMLDQCVVAAEMFLEADRSFADGFGDDDGRASGGHAAAARVEDLSTEADGKRQRGRLEATCRRQKRRIGELMDQIVNMKSEAKQKQPTRLHTGMLVALARSRGHGSAESAGKFAALVEGSNGMCGNTVASYERTAGTCLLASVRNWHSECETEWFSNWYSDSWENMCLHVIELGCDATRGGTWKEQKFQATVLTSTYFLPSTGKTAKTIWPDLVVVHDGTARGCRRILERQLALVGCVAFDPGIMELCGLRQFRFFFDHLRPWARSGLSGRRRSRLQDDASCDCDWFPVYVLPAVDLSLQRVRCHRRHLPILAHALALLFDAGKVDACVESRSSVGEARCGHNLGSQLATSQESDDQSAPGDVRQIGQCHRG